MKLLHSASIGVCIGLNSAAITHTLDQDDYRYHLAAAVCKAAGTLGGLAVLGSATLEHLNANRIAVSNAIPAQSVAYIVGLGVGHVAGTLLSHYARSAS